jgi:hypothetical protein
MGSRQKLIITALLFAAALGFVIAGMVTESVGPLFGTWVPLLIVPWILTRPEPSHPGAVQATVAPEKKTEQP